MKKQRGLRKYYKNLSIRNEFENLPMFNENSKNMWFDFWHYHFDLNGYGNNSFKRRKPHLDKLFRHFDILHSEVNKLNIKFQQFIIIHDNESDQDAIYLHSNNPNKTNFPYKIGVFKHTSTLKNKELQNYIDTLVDFQKFYCGDWCVLYKDDVGLGLID